ncbi:MAG: antibiotic biosynthesis monooxygenase [Flavobacteriales bacterium]|nr:antibiotic biosynthesis monooxygenase [Flavobacteriales bacterium]MEB2342673.1 antibiotic biosynthesis monooxygenase [Flavobacteriia bacterium]
MIVRLVKMTFRRGEEERFQALFEDWRHRIIASPGCLLLELLHDAKDPRIFFTRSEWASADFLEGYRRSPVFAEVWPVVKAMFAEKAEAWSLCSEQLMDGKTEPGQDAPDQ